MNIIWGKIVVREHKCYDLFSNNMFNLLGRNLWEKSLHMVRNPINKKFNWIGVNNQLNNINL